MAFSQGTSRNTVTDISHVLESLGSLIGELDAIQVEKVDAVNSNNNKEDAVDHDLSLETLLADTDEFDDDDRCQLIPRKTLPAKTPSSGFFSHGSQHFSHQNFNAATQGHGGLSSGSLYETLSSVSAESKALSTCTSPSHSIQFQNAAFLRTQEHESHCSVPSGSRSKAVSSLPKSNSTRTQVNDSHKCAVPPNRGGHKGAFNEVALSGDVHGSFKKVEDGSSTATAQKSVHIPASHPKAEPNHYVSPGELGLPRPSNQVNVKSNTMANGMTTSSQQMRQERHSAQVPVSVFNEDNKRTGLLVSSNMTAREACHKLALLNKVEDGHPQRVLVEHLTDLGLERNVEDHENVRAILHTWATGSKNKLLFRKDVKKYHFFAHTSNYFPPHLLDSENSDKAVTEKAQKAKTILHQKLFSTCTRVPEIEGTLQCKDFGKKSWNKKFLFLRGSGIYSSNKGKSKASKDLECYVQFDGANLYNILNPKKSHKAPTDFCFCIVPLRVRELKELKCFCVEDEKTLLSWKMAVRIAKCGPQLRQNYDDMLRKFAKLTKYRDQQSTESNCQNIIGEVENGDTCVKDGQVAMDFTGERGRIITDSKEIKELANARNKAKLSRRTSSNNFIPTDTAVPGYHFMSEPWFHGRITREQSLELLLDAGVQDGLFLVRESCSVAGVFVLTFCMNRRVYHCQLVQDIGEGTQIFFSLGKGPAFKTLHGLIHFYQQKPLNGVSLALRSPCPKSLQDGFKF